jgi:penicillin-binding protein 2
MVPARSYPFERIGAHAIGYLNEVSAEDLAPCPPLEAGSKARRPAVCGLEERGYRVGDVIGRGGVERAFEQYLRGKRGVRRSVVDAHGRRLPESTAASLLRVPQLEEPVPGHDLTLTLDLEITRMIDRIFRGHPAGAVALVEVRTGHVIALYSKPSYDPNPMLSGLSREQAAALFRDPDEGGDPLRPLLDRTLFEDYFPGSTYKIVTAIAALEGGFVTPEETLHCQGWHELGRRTFRCSQAHGNVTLRDAIVQSCNVFFYRLAERVGIDRIAVAAQDLGFGHVTGVGLNRESKGTVPTRRWHQENRLGYVQGFTLNTAIGQGSTRATLLQLAMAYAAIANGGTLYVPQVVREIRTADGAILPAPDFRPRVRWRIKASREHLALLQQGLWGVVNEELGTAYEYRIDGVDASGKTGTAQVSRSARRDELEPRMRWYFNRNHAWFAGYAPASAPELAVVVLVEHGGQGGKDASPLGLQILRGALERLHQDRSAPSLQDSLAKRPAARGAMSAGAP